MRRVGSAVSAARLPGSVGRLVLLLASLSPGCGRIDYDPLARADAGQADAHSDVDARATDGGAIDGAPFDAGSTDAGPTDGGAFVDAMKPPRCDWSVGEPPLSAPVAVTAVNTSSLEIDPFLDPLDWTTLYLASDVTGDTNVYVAHRPSLDAPFGAAVLWAPANTPFAETGLAFSSDGLEAFLSTNRDSGGAITQIFRAVRGSPSETFGPFVELAELAWPSSLYDPMPVSDGTRLYVSGTGFGAGGNDIAYASRTSRTAPFGPPMLDASLSSASTDANATFTADELTVLFTTDRAGAGGLAIWYATRGAPSDDFGPAAVVSALDDAGVQENQPYIRPDGCEVFFATRGDIYVSHVLP